MHVAVAWCFVRLSQKKTMRSNLLRAHQNANLTPPANQPPKTKTKTKQLAMLAMLGYGAQAVMTQKGPFANLADHLADPTGANILTNFGKALSGQ
jgi:hypothetical protein